MECDIARSAKIEKTARVLQLCGLFDVAPTERSESAWKVSLPIEGFDWQIGLIVGPSGSGKTTLAREAFAELPFVSSNVGYYWPEDQAVVDGFPEGMSIKDITAALSSVGFSTPPAWLRPFKFLSTGEQFRSTVARALCDPVAADRHRRIHQRRRSHGGEGWIRGDREGSQAESGEANRVRDLSHRRRRMALPGLGSRNAGRQTFAEVTSATTDRPGSLPR